MVESFIREGVRSSGAELTSRQREVLQLLVEGFTMKEAAGVLRVTARTVAFHKYRVMQQFRLKSNAELIQFAIDQRLTSAPRTGSTLDRSFAKALGPRLRRMP
jgi:DNA-binding NarL/FixJ family response regulator